MAARLNRSAKTFKKYVAEYQIPHITLGREMLFDAPKVEKFLESISTIAAPIEMTGVGTAKQKAKIKGVNPQRDFFLRELGLR